MSKSDVLQLRGDKWEHCLFDAFKKLIYTSLQWFDRLYVISVRACVRVRETDNRGVKMPSAFSC